jgi:dienelactone hydrolase
MTDNGIRIHGPRDGSTGTAPPPDRDQSDTELAIRAPERSRIDERIAVRVEGADPGEGVTVRAELTDDDDAAWTAAATFTADADGVVDLTSQAPESGDWSGVAPMGWCWAMTSKADARSPSLADRPGVDVVLEASTDDCEPDSRARETITRQVYDPAIEPHAVEADGLVGTWYEPAGEGPHPGVVSLHGSAGPGSHRVERLLATHGFATLALAYTGDAPVVPDRIREVSLTYVHDALEWFGSRPAVAAGPLGLFGVSRGAELALLVGARSNRVGAVVSYAGSGVPYDTPMGDTAWLDPAGDPVPHIEGVGEPERTDDGHVVTRPVLERGLEDADGATLDAATIRVEDIDGPVLLVSGGDDQVWPARRLSAIAADRLGEADRDAPHAHLTDDDVGHLISVPYVPLADFEHGGGTPAATAALGVDAWERTLEYFELGLPSRPGG